MLRETGWGGVGWGEVVSVVFVSRIGLALWEEFYEGQRRERF